MKQLVLVLMLLLMVACNQEVKRQDGYNCNRGGEANDNDTADYGGNRKGLNDIRFGDFDENDWLDNEYIRCLRKYLDDYSSGKIQDESLDPYKDVVKGKFIIASAEPYLMGGMLLYIIFVDHPDDFYSSWIYSTVDAEREIVLDYEIRNFSLDEEKTGCTKEDIMEYVEEHPEFKLW